MQCFRSFHTAERTLEGVEALHMAAPNLSPIEMDLIERLAVFVVWAGKYPIHIRANETNHPTFKTTDPELIDKVFEQFVAILKAENPQQTVGFA